jgi:hypothetical protein
MVVDKCSDSTLTIKSGSAAINRWRSENPLASICATNARFVNIDLSGVNLANAQLRKSSFDRCNLRHANFKSANLSYAVFSDCDLDEANFTESRLNGTSFTRVRLNNTDFSFVERIGAIRIFSQILADAPKHPKYNREASHLVDKLFTWERLRSLTKLSIFVPAYASLTFTVIYINFISWYNEIVTYVNAVAPNLLNTLHLQQLGYIHLGYTQLVVLVNFTILSVAATTLLACPARIAEYTRERWVSELREPELLYDHLAWSMPFVRWLCAACFISGGAISAFLLLKGMATQIIFIISTLH